LKKCKHCRGKDGKQKDIYETFQSAMDTANHIEKTRGVYLNVYKCEHGSGWHLTSSDSSYGAYEREAPLFHSNEIPVTSFDGSWEYVNGESDDNKELVGNIIKITKKKKDNKRKINKTSNKK